MSRELRDIKRGARWSAIRGVLVYAVLAAGVVALAEYLVSAFHKTQPWLGTLSLPWVALGLSTLIVLVVAMRLAVKVQVSEFERTESVRALSTLLGNLPGLAYRRSHDFLRTMTFVSDGSLELTGYRPDDFIDNRRVEFDRIIHPDDLERIGAVMNEALAAHQRYQVTYRIRRKDGGERWVLDHGVGVDLVEGQYRSLEGLMVDITQQKTYERTLEEQQAHLEEIVVVRTSELQATNDELGAEVERRRVIEEKLRELTIRDTLTGLYNRRVMDKFLSEELERCGRYGRALSVVMVDLDHFKNVNDTYGHQGGDDVLRFVSALLRAGVRVSDRAVRYGGEEMVLILPETELEAAWIVADRIRDQLATSKVELTDDDGVTQHIAVTMSCGVASFPAHGRTPDAVIAAADQALYRAKRGGRNRVHRAHATAGPTPTPPIPTR